MQYVTHFASYIRYISFGLAALGVVLGVITFLVSRRRTALLQKSREQHQRLDLAPTQYNLGRARFSLGWRASAPDRLGEAVAAYRAALKERPRNRVPLDWAAAQNDLGVALQTLGARESGTAHLEEAVNA